MWRIPRVPTGIEVMREICEQIREGRNTPKAIARELSKSEVTIKHYLVSMKRFGLVNRNGNGYELIEAGRKFLELSKVLPIEEALYRAIVEYGDASDVKTVLELLTKGVKPEKRSHRDFIKNWTIFLRKLKLLDDEGQLTPNGIILLNSENIKDQLRRYPSLLARKIVYCPCYEFQASDLLHKVVQHNLELFIVREKLERMGFRIMSAKLQYGNPDSVLIRDGKPYVHEHKTGKLDEVAFVQALIYSKEYEEEYGELPGIILTNSDEVKVYEREQVVDSVRILDEVIDLVVRCILVRKYTPGYYCYYCGNATCPYNQRTF